MITPHSWNVTPAQARAIQNEWRHRVITTDQLGQIHTVAGLDVGFEDGGQTSRAAVVVLDFPTLAVREKQLVRQPTRLPYIPGLLSFREVPALLAALQKLTIQPDLLLCDGQGLAHPRRFGLACHIGVLTGLPSIGVAKTRFIGQHEEPPTEKGGQVPLWDSGEQIGVVLRTRTAVKPLYISIGHKITLAMAVDYVLRCTPKYRLPETTRQADRLSKRDGI